MKKDKFVKNNIDDFCLKVKTAFKMAVKNGKSLDFLIIGREKIEISFYDMEGKRLQYQYTTKNGDSFTVEIETEETRYHDNGVKNVLNGEIFVEIF